MEANKKTRNEKKQNKTTHNPTKKTKQYWKIHCQKSVKMKEGRGMRSPCDRSYLTIEVEQRRWKPNQE